MEPRIDIPLGVSRGARRQPRFLNRPAELDPELAIASQPPNPDAQVSLSGYIPGSLIPTEKRLTALAIGGAPAWSRRLKRIDALTEQALADLEQAWRALATTLQGEPGRFARAWREQVARVDFSRVNELIRRHNLHFPAEANLRMDVRSGDFIGIGGGDYRRTPLDAEWVLERFPANLEAAAGD